MDPQSRAYSIGQVLERLKPSFPDLSISKIRFLEKEELVRPERSPGGYRKFREVDILRLKKALELQKNEYLPLNVIKERLAGWDPTSEAGGRAAGEVMVPETDVKFLSRGAVEERYGLKTTDLDELERYGILKCVSSNGESGYDEQALKLLPILASFKEFGVHGRHLKLFKTNAEKQLALIDQVLSPQMKRTGDPGKKQAVLNKLISLAQSLSEEFLNAGLKER